MPLGTKSGKVQPICIYIDHDKKHVHVAIVLGKKRLTFSWFIYLFFLVVFVVVLFFVFIRFIIFNYLQNSEEEGGRGREMQPT